MEVVDLNEHGWLVDTNLPLSLEVDVKRAIESIDGELERDPESWEAWSAKAEVLYLCQDYAGALKCCEIAINLDPWNALAWCTKAGILRKPSKWDEAAECYSKATEIEPFLSKVFEIA